MEEKFQKNIQTAVSETENTVKRDTGKTIKFYFGTTVSDRKKDETVSPKNSKESRRTGAAYGVKIGRDRKDGTDKLNGKLKIVQNKKTAVNPTTMATRKCRKTPGQNIT